jgi:hypothetical protein
MNQTFLWLYLVADMRPSADPDHLTTPLHDPDDVATIDHAVAEQGVDISHFFVPGRR